MNVPECAYRGSVAEDGRVACRNVTQLIHDGHVSLKTCSMCPYAKPRNFFTATQQLWVNKARTGEYKPVAKACGGCGSVKRRHDAVQFVWPYWHAGANGDEIRWSVRSVETMFQGTAKITIVGDCPPWYYGHHIPKKRVSARTPNRAFRDMLSKVWVMASHAEIDDVFVWMMDDVYFIKPVTIEDIATPRADRWMRSQGNSWQRRKFNTMTLLESLEKPTHDYATHLPHYVEKQLLRQMYDEHNLHKNTLLWEVLYGNLFRENPMSSRPFFARFNKQMPREQYEQRCHVASVMNHTASAWCAGIRDMLENLFPEPSKTEISDVSYVPSFRRTPATQRHVKRRPKHTHRAVIERQQRESSPSPDDNPVVIQ